MRIGIWFNECHLSYGGPSHVIVGLILGLIQVVADCVILLNEPGDINFIIDNTTDYKNAVYKSQHAVIGTLVFSGGEAEVEEYASHVLWTTGATFVAPSEWYKYWICCGLPYTKPEVAKHRSLHVWGAGVDTEYFCPSEGKSQDYFIYFKSQDYGDLNMIHNYLFENYFNMRGHVLTYYHYDRHALKIAAQKSRYCIMLDRTESQGLASLEIMACDCPLFVLDWTRFQGNRLSIEGASSVPCMDNRCGMKSKKSSYKTDFPEFLKKLPTYTPRKHVLENYSYAAAAKNLVKIMELSVAREHHQSKHNTEEDDCLNKQPNGGNTTAIPQNSDNAT